MACHHLFNLKWERRVGNGYRVLRIPDEYLVIPGYWVRVSISILYGPLILPKQ